MNTIGSLLIVIIMTNAVNNLPTSQATKELRSCWTEAIVPQLEVRIVIMMTMTMIMMVLMLMLIMMVLLQLLLIMMKVDKTIAPLLEHTS